MEKLRGALAFPFYFERESGKEKKWGFCSDETLKPNIKSKSQTKNIKNRFCF